MPLITTTIQGLDGIGMLTQPSVSGQQLLFDRALLEILDEDILGDQEIWNLLWAMNPPNKGSYQLLTSGQRTGRR